jgi:hypothetical protein
MGRARARRGVPPRLTLRRAWEAVSFGSPSFPIGLGWFDDGARWRWWRLPLRVSAPRSRLRCLQLTHGRSVQFQPLGVVDDTIQNSIAKGRLADDIAPLVDGKLAGDEG